MKTEDLIARLSAEPAAPAFDDRKTMALATLAIAVCVAIFLTLAGTRPGLLAALTNPHVLPKTLLPALAFLLVLPELPKIARPEGMAETRLWRIGLVVLIEVALYIYTLFDPAYRAQFTQPGLFGIVQCLGLQASIGIVPVVVTVRLLRRGAVASPKFAGTVAGFVAGTGTAAGYSLWCTRDNPLFYLLWYGVAIAVATLVGRYLGSRWLRW